MSRIDLIRLRRGTAAQWTSVNPVLADGEPGAERDTGRLKIGDGTTAWNSLGYTSAVARGDQVLSAIKRRLDLATSPLSIAIVGDSTGNDSTDWPRRMIQKPGGLAEAYPAYTFEHLRWSDGDQAYGSPLLLQAGSAERASLRLGDGKYLATPDASWFPTGNQIHRLRLNIGAAIGTGERVLVAKFGGAGQRSFRLICNSLGLDWEVSSDGTNLTLSPSAITFTALYDTWIWLELRLVLNDGAGGSNASLWWKPDTTGTWMQLGPTVTGSAMSMFDSTAPLEVGIRSSAGTTDWDDGYVSDYYLMSGITGSEVMVAGWAAGQIEPGATTAVGYRGETWTVVGAPTLAGAPSVVVFNGSHAGSVIAYADDDTRFPKLCPVPPDLFVINYGHNETSEPPAWATAFDAVVTRARALNERCAIMASIQNPQRVGASNPQRHARRCQGLAEQCARSNYGAVDAFQAFLDYGNWSTNLMADDVHPNAAGYDLWADEAIAMLGIT